MSKTRKFVEARQYKPADVRAIDRYDAMEPGIDRSSSTAKQVAQALIGANIPVVEVTDADFDVDAQIRVSDRLTIQVELNGFLDLADFDGQTISPILRTKSVQKLIAKLRSMGVS